MSRRRHPLSVLGSCALCTPWCWWLCSGIWRCIKCAGFALLYTMVVVLVCASCWSCAPLCKMCGWLCSDCAHGCTRYHSGSAQASLEWQPPQGPRPSHDPPLFVKSNQKLIYFSSEKYATSNQQNTLTDRTSTESGDNSKYVHPTENWRNPSDKGRNGSLTR